MDTLYSSHLHNFQNINKMSSTIEPALTQEGVLSLVIVLGSSISLVGLVFAFITYSLFSDLRNFSGTALMNLLAAMFMTQLLYVIGVGGILDSELCVSLVFSLQYVRLCVLCWLLTIVHHMHKQFKIHLHTLIPRPDATSISKNFIVYSIFSWGFPALLLVTSVTMQYTNNSGNLFRHSNDGDNTKAPNCWFLDNQSFLLCFLIPSCIFFVMTIWYLIRSTVSTYRAITMQLDKKIREKMMRRRTMQVTLFCQVTFAVYSVVILGAFYHYKENNITRMLYHVAQGIQGLLLSILVTCNCRILKLYNKSLVKTKRKMPQLYGVDKKTLNKSTSMQLLTWESPPDIV